MPFYEIRFLFSKGNSSKQTIFFKLPKILQSNNFYNDSKFTKIVVISTFFKINSIFSIPSVSYL